MKVYQKIILNELDNQLSNNDNTDLVFCFGSKKYITDPMTLTYLKQNFPNSEFIGCTTSGEISNNGISDDTLVLTVVEFSRASIKSATVHLNSIVESYSAGIKLAKELGVEFAFPSTTLMIEQFPDKKAITMPYDIDKEKTQKVIDGLK